MVWERRTEWPLVVAALMFLLGYALPILDPGVPPALRSGCTVILAATWLVFVVDFLGRIWFAERRGHYLVRHLPDLLVLAVPILRPLRLLRLLVLVKVLNRQAGNALRGRVAIYVGAAAVTVIFCAALAVLDAERGRPGANIATFGDAAWWAVTTVMTVGYGDRYPVTVEGRFVAVGLMVAGIALIGVVTASFATWLIDKVRQVEAESRAATSADVNALRTEMTALREQLALRADESTGNGSTQKP
ncbi:voltage-gated potassium channel [Nakamurella panacisegetis]|uniref:Voltage-gated potassium channel n=2 Tax=Nakamurella panacisegetis TaxID=1090615 RepID=A0A1H0QQ01_9ACTN|nr:voltage-gated potassium channel [Nakamurella panacisegetis]